jgi:hypothetical protein
MDMKNGYYPGLFRAANSASLSAQKTYIIFQTLYLGSLILGSVVSTSSVISAGFLSVCMRTTIAIILFFGLLILWVSRFRRDDKTWFDCRAIAESVKTATWRFMMNMIPVQNGESANKRFIEELSEIRKARRDCLDSMTNCKDLDANLITDFMKQMRARSFDDRKAFYIENRLHNQKKWYSKKASLNSRNGSRWFWITLILQAIAVIIAFIQVSSRIFVINIVPILTTAAAAIAAWTQMKRHDELAKAYSLTEQELNELEAIAGELSQERDFPQLVEQIEGSISREHTMWCARRDVPLKKA